MKPVKTWRNKIIVTILVRKKYLLSKMKKSMKWTYENFILNYFPAVKYSVFDTKIHNDISLDIRGK